MLRIGLINMPFADTKVPSIALTQLQTVINATFPSKVEVNLFYFNHEVAIFLEPSVYDFISNSAASNNSGFGDWFFRQEGFPFLQDNTAGFFDRYSSHFGEENMAFYFDFLQEKRQQLGDFLENLILLHSLHEYDIIGFTSMFMQNVASFALARKIKEKNKKVTIVVGGANCESPMGQEIVKNLEYIDYVFSGTALKSFPAFVGSVLAEDAESREKINGVFSKTNLSGSIRQAGDELSLDAAVQLDYDPFLESYGTKLGHTGQKPYLLIETSRGCWWGAKAHCTFCGLNGGNMFYRLMKPDVAIDFFNTLFEKYASRVDHFSSVDNIIPKEYLIDVFPKLDVPDNVTLFYEVRADLSPAELAILSKARVLEIQPGIESLATSTLKRMKKGTSSFNNLKFLKNVTTYGISPAWNLLVGFPEESEAVYKKYLSDIPQLYHLPPPAGVFPVRFDRFSPYFMKAADYLLELQPLDYYPLIYPFSASSLANMAYYFGDTNYTAEYIATTSFWLNDLQAAVKKWSDRWSGNDGLALPTLYLDQDGDNIVLSDSRYGTEKKHYLTSLQIRILDNLTVHKKKEAAFSELRIAGNPETESEFSWLWDNGFLFEENGTFLSLVMDGAPVLSSTAKAYH
ncbi:MAG TPA: RiPP maturation radical SAM C-methyltransferase [Puia sp.]|nr:RiPP maturation radical SAM C-methyltransferase [Puia sp.]